MGLFTKIIDLQKLGKAWDKVKANHPIAGTDGVSVEEFESKRRENLMQLHLELIECRYVPQPVRMICIKKNQKDRNIGLISMRDKVIQQSIQLELSRKYDPFLSEFCFAYRNNYSALSAIERLHRKIKENERKELWIYKGDITNFFENINLEVLLSYLKRDIKEQELVELLKCCLYMPYFDENGEMRKKEKGIFQGSSLSPILSNVYMMEFDHEMEKQGADYFRYSDDFLFLGKNKQQMEIIKENVEHKLGEIELEVKKEKTVLCSLKKGIEFLGYHFNEKGKEIPAKAGKELAEKLEVIWLNPKYNYLPIEEKLAQGCGIINGWAQYYPDIWNRCIPNNIYEYVILLHLAVRRKQDELVEKLHEQRKHYKNVHKDIVIYLCGIWSKFFIQQDCLFEYEQYFQIEAKDQEKIKCVLQENKDAVSELLEEYRLLLINETETYYSNIIQFYTDFGCYNKAEGVLEKQKERKNCTISTELEDFQDISSENREERKENIKLTQKQIETYMELFIAREDIFAQASAKENGKRYYEMVKKPLLLQEILSHLSGEKTVASYVSRSNHTVKYMVIDIDLSKKILLKYPIETKEFQEYMRKAKRLAIDLSKKLKNMGISAWIEYSGFRGYHVWVFFNQWINCRYVWQLEEVVSEEKLWQDGDINVEFFPNKTKIREGQAGQVIKLPFGKHDSSGKITYFIDKYGQEFDNQAELLSIALENRTSLDTVKQVLAKGMKDAGREKELLNIRKEIKKEDIQVFGKQPERIQLILEKCGFMHYLCMKAKNTGYLTHGERLSILYVFGHIGELGKEFIHTIMAFTLNYQYSITERFILKCPAKPISCIKLQEQYKMITAEIGCNCNFRGMKNCYPSPVLHVLKEQQDIPKDVTLPSTRNVTKEREKEMYGEINIHNKTEELALKLIEMKKQKRGVDRVIRKCEEELCSIFDHAEIDCIELEMGILLRRKTEHGYEWLIEL